MTSLQRANGINVIAITMLACLCCGTGVVSAQHDPRNDTRRSDKGDVAVVLASTTPSDSFDLRGKTQPILVSFANLGNETIYVPVIDKPRLVLQDMDGKAILGAPVDEPPAPPASHYMIRAGRRVLMEPVWKLDPGAGVVRVISDPLQRYRGTLRTGQNRVTISLASLPTYTEDQIVVRDDVDHKLWVEAGPVREERAVLRNSLSISVTSAKD